MIEIYPDDCFMCHENDGIPEAYGLEKWNPDIRVNPRQRIGTSFAFSCGHTIHEECWNVWLVWLRSIGGVIPSCGRCRRPIDMELIPQESLRRRVRREYSAAYSQGCPQLSTIVCTAGISHLLHALSWRYERQNKYFKSYSSASEGPSDPRIYGSEEPIYAEYMTRLGPRGLGPNCLVRVFPRLEGEYIVATHRSVCFPEPSSWALLDLQDYPIVAMAAENTAKIWEASYYAPDTPTFLIVRIMTIYLACRAVRNFGEHRVVRLLAGGVAATRVAFDHYCPSVIKNVWKKLVG